MTLRHLADLSRARIGLGLRQTEAGRDRRKLRVGREGTNPYSAGRRLGSGTGATTRVVTASVAASDCRERM